MKKYKGEILLLLAAFLWGTSLVAQKLGTYHLGPCSFGAARTLLGALCLVPVILLMDSRKTKEQREEEKRSFKTRDLLMGGFLSGCMLAIGSIMQQWALTISSVGKTGFICTMYVVVVPLISILRGKKVSGYTWLAIGSAVVGLYFLCVTDGFTVGIGDIVLLVSTIFWALQIIFIGEYADKTDGLKLTLMMFVTTGIISLVAALLFENPTMGAVMEGIKPLLYTAVFAVAGGYSLQALGQKTADSVTAGIIFSTEAIFSAVCAAVLLNERMSIREWVGAVFIFAALLLSQKKSEKEDIA